MAFANVVPKDSDEAMQSLSIGAIGIFVRCHADYHASLRAHVVSKRVKEDFNRRVSTHTVITIAIPSTTIIVVHRRSLVSPKYLL